MECGHKGKIKKGYLVVMKDLKPYSVIAEYRYCHKCKKVEISNEEKTRIKKLIDEEVAKDEQHN